MNRALRILLNLIKKMNIESITSLKLMIGQSAILSSRTGSNKFTNLWDAEVKVFSQWGEDGILDFICETLKISKPKVVEIGAGNFNECNSRFLAESRNASVVAIDARTDLVAEVKKMAVFWKTHIFPMCEMVTPININELLAIARDKMAGIDILSLDIDGNDYWVLDAANLDKISVLVVEYNSLFGNLAEVSVPRDDLFNRKEKHFSCLYYGASLPAFIYSLSLKGFTFLGSNRACNNAFFVKNEKIKEFSIEIPSNLELFVDSRVREGRDISGSLSFLSGNDRLKAIETMPVVYVKNNIQGILREIF
jgi:hypothetical protein